MNPAPHQSVEFLLEDSFRDDAPEPSHHLLEDCQFSAGQADGSLADRQLSSDSVETDIPALERYSQHTTGTPQKRFDTSNQLGHCKGFGQIIVSSRIETRDPVLDRIPRRQNQNWERFCGRSRGG